MMKHCHAAMHYLPPLLLNQGGGNVMMIMIMMKKMMATPKLDSRKEWINMGILSNAETQHFNPYVITLVLSVCLATLGL